MDEYMHLIRDKRVAELALQFCKLFGAENADLIFDRTHCDFNLYYEAPAKFNLAVDALIHTTEKLANNL